MIAEKSKTKSTRITQDSTVDGLMVGGINVNGRKYFVERIASIEPGDYSYEWVGTTLSNSRPSKKSNSWPFKIYGGKEAGFRSNEWFAEFLGCVVPCTSAVDALRMVNSA